MAPVQVLIVGALSLLAIVATMSTDWSTAETVTVIATEYGFDPSHLTFRVGARYRLQFENRGKELHEFTAPGFLKAVEIANPESLNPDHTEIVARPGERKELFFVPARAGRYPLSCADHDWAGMTGDIVVE
jgi:plastocyanin